MLANFMGVYWLAAGVISLRWGASGERARGFSVLAGVIGVLAGLGMLGRNLVPYYVAAEFFFCILGMVILLTGLLHIFGGFKKASRPSPAEVVDQLLVGAVRGYIRPDANSESTDARYLGVPGRRHLGLDRRGHPYRRRHTPAPPKPEGEAARIVAGFHPRGSTYKTSQKVL